MSEAIGMEVIFSARGAAVLGVMAEALDKARHDGCDCDVCSMLRAATDALIDTAEGIGHE